MLRNWILKTTDFLAGPPACAILGHCLTLKNRSKAPADWIAENTRRILIIRPGGIGDMILLLPTLAALSDHFPSAEIDIVCERRNMAVIALSNIKAKCIPYDTNPYLLIRNLLQTSYDLTIDSEQFHHFSAVFSALSGAPVRIGFNINPRRNGLYTHLIPYSPDNFEADEFTKLLKPLEINPKPFDPSCSACSAPPSTVLNQKTLSLLMESKSQSKLIVMHAGGSIPRKLWPQQRMHKLLSRLLNRNDASIVILGAREDMARCTSLYEDFKGNPRVFCIAGDLNLSQCAALIDLADIFIGPDSGLLHLAVSLDKPTIAVFGPSSRRKWGFENSKHIAVCKDLPCSPCCIFGYSKPCRHYQCIEDISAEQVLNAFDRLETIL